VFLGNRYGFFKVLITIIALFSIVVTGTLGFMIITNLDGLGRAAQVFALIKSQSLTDADLATLIGGATAGMVQALDDPYSAYLEPELYQDLQGNIQGTYGGVGLLITMDTDQRLTVVSPFKGTPAQRAGIVSGDQILRIDDRDTSELDLEQAAALMQGEPGTQVVLLIYRQGQSPWEVTLVREVIEIPTVEGQYLEDYPGIAYIAVTNFTEHTGAELGQLIIELQQQQLEGLVLDLRNNPGGSLPAALEVASFFIPQGPVVYIHGKGSSETLNTVHPHRIEVPLVVLVNGGSASASEIVAGAIKDTGAGKLVGETTFGKGLVQTVFPLTGGAAVKLTTAKYLTPGQHDIHEVGIHPDVEVELTPEQEREALAHAPAPERDPQLAEAVKLLQNYPR
jgi:carboxyl-terminal processing protease